jgi:iron complex outermembrane receptor protein
MLKQKHLCAALAVVFAGGFGFAANAQQAQAEKKDVAKVERVEVTGTNIRRVDFEGPQPVVVVSRDDIEKSGKSTLNEVLQNLTAVSGGSFSEASLAGNSFAPGTSSVSLRGLGVNTTLVLLNGRRIANYGFAQNINEGFVDLNSIPVNAIERIDILKDGASAIYGSDAIAGVINVILRRDYTGVELSASYGDSQDGGGGETRASVTAGFGSLGTNRFNVMGTLDYYKRDAINSQQRAFSKSADQRGRGPGGRDVRSPTGNPGYWFGTPTGQTPANVNTAFANCPPGQVVSAATLGVGGGGTVCAFDFAYANNLIPASDRIGGFLRGVLEVTPNIQVFAEAMANRNTTDRTAAPTPAAFGAAGHPDRPVGSTFTSVAYRFVEAGNRLNETTTDSTRFVLGAKANFFGTDVEFAANRSESETTDIGKNYIIQERATEAFAGTLAGFTGQRYRVVDPSLNPAGMLDAIKINPKRVGTSTLTSFDGKASRELFSMAGGQAAIAAGFEWRKEEVSDTPDFRVDLRNPNRVSVSGSGGTAVQGDRDLKSFFAEFSLPFAKGWESQLALRTDRYSDFGTATTPKVALSWRPNNKFLVRGGYAEGFRAPSLAEVYLGESTSFPVVQDAPRCQAYRNGPLGPNDARTLAVCGGATGNGASAQVRSIFLGNRNLRPEESESWNFGFVFEPTRNLSFAVDYYSINHDNRILAPTAAFILSNEALFPGAVTRNTPSADDIAANAPGGLRGVSGDTVPGITRTFFNASKQKTNGVDLDVRYQQSLGSYGKLDMTTGFTYVTNLRRQLNPGQPLVQLIGTFQFPRWRNVTGATWTYGAWSTNATWNTTSAYYDAFSVSGVFPKVRQFSTLDAQVAYTGIKNLRISVGGQNIANKMPPFSNTDWYAYDASTHSPRGAYWYGRITYQFK